MEVNITKAFNDIAGCAMDYSASRAEIGDDAGPTTWRAACDDAGNFELLQTAEQLQAMRDFARGFGAWSDDEIAAWSDDELRALLLQFIAGDMRESGLDCEAPDWDGYAQGCEDGIYPSRIFRGDDGSIYFELGE